MKRAILIALILAGCRHESLPTYGAVPAFTLVDASGARFDSAALDGKPWVADFIFTSCPEVCPRMTEEMARLQSWLINRALDGRVRLVSVSVDPARDTPAALRQYAAQFRAQPRTWIFLTGDQKTIEDAVVRGFKIGVSRERDDSQDAFAIVHGTKFVLVDGKRQIRGYYDPNDRESMGKLRRDLEELMR